MPDVNGATGADAPQEGLAYHQLHRAGPWGDQSWWRSLLGTFGLGAGVLVSAAMIGTVAVALGYSIDTDRVTPAALVVVNLTLAVAIPISWLLVRLLHGLRPRWLASVAPRIRWRWFAVCLALSVAALVATVLVAALLPAQGGTEMAGRANDFTSTTRDFLLVVLLLTPLQAAGEEYAFRGYLTQAFGGIFRSPVPAVVLPSVLFALAHGAQDAPIFVDRLAFGLVAGTLVILTGGLEAGIAMHVLNNWLAFGLALAFGDMSSALNPTGGTWWSLPVTLTQSLVYLVLAVLVARRMGLQTRTRPGVLEAPRARV